MPPGFDCVAAGNVDAKSHGAGVISPYDHVMWDVEAFVVSVLTVMQPGAAHSILDYRFKIWLPP